MPIIDADARMPHLAVFPRKDNAPVQMFRQYDDYEMKSPMQVIVTFDAIDFGRFENIHYKNGPRPFNDDEHTEHLIHYLKPKFEASSDIFTGMTKLERGVSRFLIAQIALTGVVVLFILFGFAFATGIRMGMAYRYE